MDLATRRRVAGMTQVELARRSGALQQNISAYESGKRTASPAVQERLDRALQLRPSEQLQAKRTEIQAAVKRHRASGAVIIGSVARGGDRPGSDFDLVVTFDAEASLFDEIALRIELEELLGVRVDVLAADSLSPELCTALKRDGVSL